jgi:hypothetical protein
MSFAYALLALNLLATRQLPPGAPTAHPVDPPYFVVREPYWRPVDAVLIAPWFLQMERLFSRRKPGFGKD